MIAVKLTRDLTLADGAHLEPHLPILKGEILFKANITPTTPGHIVVLRGEGLVSKTVGRQFMFSIPEEATVEVPEDEI